MSKRTTNEKLAIGIGVAIMVPVLGLLFFPSLVREEAEQNFASETSGGVVTSSSLMQITDSIVGTGTEAVAGKRVTVHYVGKLADGTVFDASAAHGAPFSFDLGAGRVIAGWDEGVVGMKVGGKRTLVIPPELGYGASGYPPVIPPNATLTFDIELLNVEDR
jgi:FKBP-type peptidyl-prolyl cis-trans isomerase